MRTHSHIVVLAASLALILTACGAGGGPSTSISLTMTDFTFLPNTLTVPAGKEITMSVTNGGAVAHDFMIMKLGHEVSGNGHVGAAEHANVYWEHEMLEAGQTQQTKFTAPNEPGEYQIVCGVAGHFEAGMVGKLIVVDAP
jgi:uncharacterized cupredoxin-like copper-binding protein